MARFILVHHLSKLSRLIQKYKGLIEEVVMFGQGFVPIRSQVHIFLKSQGMEVVLVSMSSHYHPQQLLFTKQKCWYKKFVQNCQSSSKHFLDLGARVLNFKEVYLAHLLVFLSDSKNILLLKCLLANHFKSFKEFSMCDFK